MRRLISRNEVVTLHIYNKKYAIYFTTDLFWFNLSIVTPIKTDIASACKKLREISHDNLHDLNHTSKYAKLFQDAMHEYWNVYPCLSNIFHALLYSSATKPLLKNFDWGGH